MRAAQCEREGGWAAPQENVCGYSTPVRCMPRLTATHAERLWADAVSVGEWTRHSRDRAPPGLCKFVMIASCASRDLGIFPDLTCCPVQCFRGAVRNYQTILVV